MEEELTARSMSSSVVSGRRRRRRIDRGELRWPATETAMVAALQHVREVRSSTRRWRGLWRSSEAGRGGEGRPVATATASDGGGSARVRSGKREPGRRESEREGKRTGAARGVVPGIQTRRGEAGRQGGRWRGRARGRGRLWHGHTPAWARGRRRQRSWRAGPPPGWAGLLLLGCAWERPR